MLHNNYYIITYVSLMVYKVWLLDLVCRQIEQFIIVFVGLRSKLLLLLLQE